MIFAKPVLSSDIHIHFHISIVASRCSVNEISNDLSCTYIHTQKDCTSVRILSRATVKLLQISYTARSFPFVFHFSRDLLHSAYRKPVIRDFHAKIIPYRQSRSVLRYLLYGKGWTRSVSVRSRRRQTMQESLISGRTRNVFIRGHGSHHRPRFAIIATLFVFRAGFCTAE